MTEPGAARFPASARPVPELHLQRDAHFRARLALLDDLATGPGDAAAAKASGLVREVFIRKRDGLSLKFEASQTFLASGLETRAKRAVSTWPNPSTYAFSGHPLGEWVRSSPSPQGSQAAISVRFGTFVVAASLDSEDGRRRIAQTDLLRVERLLRRNLSRLIEAKSGVVAGATREGSPYGAACTRVRKRWRSECASISSMSIYAAA